LRSPVAGVHPYPRRHVGQGPLLRPELSGRIRERSSRAATRRSRSPGIPSAPRWSPGPRGSLTVASSRPGVPEARSGRLGAPAVRLILHRGGVFQGRPSCPYYLSGGIWRPRIDLAPEVQLQKQDEPLLFIHLINEPKIAEPDPKAAFVAFAPLNVKIRLIEVIPGDMPRPCKERVLSQLIDRLLKPPLMSLRKASYHPFHSLWM